MIIVTLGNALSQSLNNIWTGVANYIPILIAAIFVVIVGWVIGAILFRLVEKLAKLARLDNALRAAGFEKILEKSGFRLNSGYFLGKLIEWFTVIVFLVAALGVLGLSQVTLFLNQIVLGYLPQVIVAVFIILIAALVAESMKKLVIGTAKAAGAKSANFAGNVTKWAIWIFAILAAIMQLGIAVSLIQTLFTGVVIAVSLAIGLAFGLGGQDAAARYIEKVREDSSDR